MDFVAYIEVDGIECEVHAELAWPHEEDAHRNYVTDPKFFNFKVENPITGEPLPLSTAQLASVVEQMVEDYYDRL